MCESAAVQLDALGPDQLDAATRVLAVACAHDAAAAVAEEKLFGGGPTGSPAPRALGAWEGGELAGVAAVAGDRLRLLAVAPAARGRGIGTALLAACQDIARAAGVARLRALDQPGNYLAPGIDDRNAATIAWLERRGWRRHGEPRVNLLVDVRGNPRVTPARAAAAAAALAAAGYEIRRARPDEPGLLDAVAAEFGGAWPHEVARALAGDRGHERGHAPGPAAGPGAEVSGDARAGVHVAMRGGVCCAFAAHDGNNRGLGWFGPAGTWPAHRGRGLGEALLLACLVDVAAVHARCEIAWIGPRAFYERVAGVTGERRFALLVRDL